MKNIFFFYSIFFKICFFSIIFLLFYSYFIPENLLDISVEKRFLKWSKEHWLGTDQLGRNFFSFLVIATRNSIFFATLALLLGSLLGTLLAIFSFYFIKTNYLWEQISQLLIAIPVVLIAIIIHTFYGSGWFSLLAISFFNVPFFYYLTKNISHKILAKEYALFSLAIGNSKWNIYRLHIFPQLYGAWLVQFSIQWSFCSFNGSRFKLPWFRNSASIA